jgi:glucose/arabinose dehydrogenase
MRSKQWSSVAFLIFFIATFLLKINAFSQTYPAGFAQSLVVNGISNPTVMAFAPDGRIFVAQQNGHLRIVKNGALLPTSFVQLTVNASGERGLIGIALDPDFSNNQFVYLYYTVPGTPAHNRISRFTANGDVVLSGSENIILELDPLGSATNHNGGALAFGPDGKLYVAIGDNATSAHAQNQDTYHGKILRINPDGSIPSDNPFTSGSDQRKRTWAMGLRNPYTISFQRGTGKFFVNDVGQVTWEEINDATTGGLNFGWPATEGNFNPATHPAYTNPVYSYQHGSGDGVGCAITGGAFFNPISTNYPGTYYGKYFFLDYCNRWINSIDPVVSPAVRSPFATTISGSPVIMEVGNDGNLYFLSRANSALYKIVYNNTSVPFIINHPADVQIMEGLTPTFTVSAIGTEPFTYQWQKDNVNISGATNQSFSITNVDPADEGQYQVIITNAAGSATSNVAVLSVIPVNDFPVAIITAPADGALYVAGTSISFSGTGNDVEDGALPASAFSWQIDFHHDTHVHDQPPVSGTTAGTFDIPNEGETSDNVWYRIFLKVTDSDGLTMEDSVDIFPRKSTLSFLTNPPGLQLTIDGNPLNTPASVMSVEGMLRSIGAVSPQLMDGVHYEFNSWSHGGDVTQTLTTPTEDVEYTANFSIVVGTEHPHVLTALEIYPNPAEDGAAVMNIRAHSICEGRLRIVDALSGDKIKLSISLVAGENTIPLAVNKLSKGMYFIIMEVGHEKWTRKILVK